MQFEKSKRHTHSPAARSTHEAVQAAVEKHEAQYWCGKSRQTRARKYVMDTFLEEKSSTVGGLFIKEIVNSFKVTIFPGGARGGLQLIRTFAGREAQQISVTVELDHDAVTARRQKTVTQSILEMFLSRDAHSNNHDKN